MAVFNKKTIFQCDIQQVWDQVTSFDNSSWRSDLKEIERIDEERFIEIRKDGYETTFTITDMQPLECLEVDIENDHIRGHWKILFSQVEAGTMMDMTKEMRAKKIYESPFVKQYLQKQQETYVECLKQALGCEVLENE